MSTNNTTINLDDFPATTYEEWRAAAEESLKGAPFEKKLITRTHEGIDLQPIYNQADLDALKIPENWPGLAPFLRGLAPAKQKAKPWLLSQEIPYGLPAEFNAALLEDLGRGQTAVSMRVDAATRKGLDSDQVSPELVGNGGVCISLLSDLERSLDEVVLDAVPVFVWAGASAFPLLSAYAAMVEKKGLELSSLQGGVVADPISEWVAAGAVPTDVAPVYDEMAETVRWAEKTGLRTIAAQGSCWADAGAHGVEELAFTLASATESLREMVKRDICPCVAASKVLFEFSVGTEIFANIAKLRAARLLWWKIVDAFGGKNGAMFLHARSASFNKSSLDPHTNMLRATAEAFAAVMGGADSLHVAPFDAAFRTPDEFSRRIARNVQIILSEECGFADPADAAGGSWYIESYTKQMAEKAWALFQEIEAAGGIVEALKKGVVQSAVAATAAKRMDAVASRRDSLIGVNLFPNVKEVPLAGSPDTGAEIYEARVREVQFGRTDEVGQVADFASAVIAWKSGASISEVSKAHRAGVEKTQAVAPLVPVRASAAYEGLRANAYAYAQANGGELPKIWLANFGPPKQCKARADFSTGFFTPGGFDVVVGAGAKSVEEAVSAAVAAVDAGAKVVVICSSDDTYPEIVPAFVPALLAQKPGVRVILAGYPAEQVEAHKAVGVQDFIHLRVNCYDFNRQLQTTLGIA